MLACSFLLVCAFAFLLLFFSAALLVCVAFLFLRLSAFPLFFLPFASRILLVLASAFVFLLFRFSTSLLVRFFAFTLLLCALMESPDEASCLRFVLNRNRQLRGYEPESPNEGACLRYMINRARQMRGRV